MIYTVSVEGQTIPVPEEIGASDESVKRALAPFYPEVANALITRTVKALPDGKDSHTTITVVKRAGSKGTSNPIEFLLACPGCKNPAIALYEEISAQDMDPLAQLELDNLIDAVIAEGEKQARAQQYASERLQKSAPLPSPFVVKGF